jgi:hypothetical protein
MQLQNINPQPLTIFSNNRDVLRDLFTYVDYVGAHSVKRMTRSNDIPRADMKRLAKLLGDITFEPGENEIDGALWIDFVDDLALRLGLVSYDIKGEYRGYSSSEPSFTDNYINVRKENLNRFQNLSPVTQEKEILEKIIRAKSQREYDNYSNNEFYHVSLLGILEPFTSWGSATGLMPTLKFSTIRVFLLDLLSQLPAGQWFSVESLIAYMKANHPYFLIPEQGKNTDKWGRPTTRYGNFYEGAKYWQPNENAIPDDAPDGFERVEGRYIERFLEYIPLVMRFVDVAYDPQPYKGLLPSLGKLKAFRVTERFLRVMNGQESEPKVTIQPNFDVIIESDFYPQTVISQLTMLGEQVADPLNGHGAYVGIFQLNKTAVAAAQVQDANLNVVELLRNLSGRDLPPNVQIELEEWAGHADQFTLYDGFSLLEMADPPSEAEKYITERIAPDLCLVRKPQSVFSTLETLGHVPLRVTHLTEEFTLVAESSRSIFPKESKKAEEVVKLIKVAKIITISYHFPDMESFQAIQKMLAELRCPFQADSVTYTVNIHQNEQEKFDEAVKKLADSFVLEIE